MGRKSFKEKEQEFLAKNKITSDTKTSGYVPQKTDSEKALELLQKAGFQASFKDGVVYCICEDNNEYEKYKAFLLKHFNKDNKVSFSYGATIKNYIEEIER